MNRKKDKSQFKYCFLLIIIFIISSCEVVDELKTESTTEKTIRIFTEGGVWNVDTLVAKTDVLSGSISTITPVVVSLFVCNEFFF